MQKKRRKICKAETDSHDGLRECPLSLDEEYQQWLSVWRVCVQQQYGHRNELITGKCIMYVHTDTHLSCSITMVKIFHLELHLLIVTTNMPEPEGKEISVKPKKP